MWKPRIAALIFLCLAQTASAENLQLFERDVQWVSAPVSSCAVTIGVENTGIDDDLVGWQLICQIVPDGEVSGTVSFAFGPWPDYYRPSHYVLPNSEGIKPAEATLLGQPFSDVATDPPSVSVQGSDNNLFRLNLISSDAVGRFDIMVVPYDEVQGTGSMWFGTSSVHGFDIVPESCVMASLEFPHIPEPASVSMLLSGMIPLVLLRCVIRRRMWPFDTRTDCLS
jgi:hypothetical protein